MVPLPCASPPRTAIRSFTISSSYFRLIDVPKSPLFPPKTPPISYSLIKFLIRFYNSSGRFSMPSTEEIARKLDYFATSMKR